MTRIADNNTRTKHNEEIAFFNKLVIDLKLVVIHRTPIALEDGEWIDMPRLEEATRHLAKLSQCKEQVRWK